MLAPEFIFKPSAHYRRIVSISLLATIAVCLYSPTPLWLKVLSMLLVGFYGVYLLQRSQPILTIQQHDSSWRVCTQTGVYAAELCGDSTVTSWVSILRFSVPNRLRKISCIVLPDSLPSGMYRKLQIACKA